MQKTKEPDGKAEKKGGARSEGITPIVKRIDLQQEPIVKAPFSTCDHDELGVVGWRRNLAVIAVKRVRMQRALNIVFISRRRNDGY